MSACRVHNALLPRCLYLTDIQAETLYNIQLFELIFVSSAKGFQA